MRCADKKADVIGVSECVVFVRVSRAERPDEVLNDPNAPFPAEGGECMSAFVPDCAYYPLYRL